MVIMVNVIIMVIIILCTRLWRAGDQWLSFLHLTDIAAETNPQIYGPLSEAECVCVLGGLGGEKWFEDT